MSSKSNKRGSLLTQLENMHKQLNEGSEGSSESQQNAGDVTQGPAVKKSSLFSNVLNKREKTNSMPTFAGSPAHNGVLTANNGKDMSFVMGLSENLLVECRRLQAENEKKNLSLIQLQKEYTFLEEKHEKIDSYQQVTTKEVTALRDTNWELEVKLQQFSVEFKELKDKLHKNKKELKNEQERSSTTKAELEVVILEKSGFQKELSRREKEYSFELAELRKNVSELNDENDSLYAKIKNLDEKAIEHETLQGELTNSNQLVDSLKKQLTELESKLENSSDSRILEAQLSKSETTVNELKVQLKEFEKRDDNSGRLKQELSRTHELTNKLSQQIVTLETNTHSHVGENLSLKSSLEEINKESKQLRKQVAGLKKVSNERDDTSQENAALQSSLRKSQQPANELGQQINVYEKKRRAANSDKKGKNKRRYNIASMDTSKTSDVESDVSGTMERPINLKSVDDETAATNEEFEISLEEIERYARFYNKRLVSEIEYSNVRSKKETDSEEKLVSTVGNTNLLALPNDLSSQKKSVEDPMSIETMIKRVESSGYKVLSFPEFNERQERLKELENPSEAYLKSKAAHHNKVLVPQDLHDKMIHPSASQLKRDLEKLGFTVMDDNEYQKLLGFIESPQLGFLEAKLANMDRVTISNEDLRNYTSPDLGFIKDQARNKGYTTITHAKYEDMQKMISEPSAKMILSSLEKNDFRSILFQFSKKHDLVLLNKKDYDQLVSALANPSKQYLIEKCPTQQIQPLSINEYQNMLQTFKNPTLEFMDEKASSMNKKLIPFKTYEKLQKTSENPTIDFLRQHTEKNKFILLPKDDHDTLQRTLNDPSIDYLQSKAKNHKLVDLKTYDRLNESFNNPSLEFLTERSSIKGYDVLSSKEHQELFRRAMHPSEDELSQLARDVGTIILQVDEYEYLKGIASSPPKEFILEKANTLNMIVMDENEYKELKNASSDKNALLSSVKGFGFMPIPVPELNSLRSSTLENSGLKDIEKRLKTLGYVAVHSKQFSELNKQIVDRATKEDTLLLCSKYSFKPISVEEYEKLKNDSQPTVYSEDELIGMLRSHGYAVIPVNEYENVVKTFEYPTVEFLGEHAVKNDKVLLDRNTHEKYVNIINNPTLEYLSEKVSILGNKVIGEKEYENLRSQVDLPSTDFLRKKAALYNLTLIPHEKYDKLMNDAKNPSLSTLQTKAVAMRKHVIDNGEYGELKRKTSFPTKEELESLAATLNMVIVVKDEYDGLLKRLEHPTLEFLERNLSQLQYLAIPSHEHHALQKNIKEPSEHFLSEKAASRGILLLNKSDYESQIDTIENPHLQYLKEKAESRGLLLLNKSEHESNVNCLENPSPEYLKEKGTSVGMVLLSSSEYKNQIDALENPSIQYLSEKAKHHSKVLVSESEVRTSEQTALDDGIAKGRLVVITKEELDELQESAQNPSISFMISKLKGSNYVALDGYKFDEMKRQINSPHLNELVERAKAYGHVLVRSKTLAEKTNAAIEDLDSLTKDNAFLLLNAEEYDNLLNSNVDRLTQREVLQMCDKLELIPVPHFEYDELRSPPTATKIQEYASKLGLAVIPQKDFDLMAAKLEEPLEKSVKVFAEENNLLMIEKKSYENLLVRINTPTRDELKETAKRLDLVLVPSKQYEIITNQSKYKPSSSSLRNVKEHTDALIPTNSDSDSQQKEPVTKGYTKYSNLPSTPNFSQSDIYQVAGTLGLNVLPTKEYNSLVQKNFDSKSLTLSDVQEYATRHGMKLVPLTGQGHGGSPSQLKLTVDDVTRESVLPKRSSTSTIGSDLTDYFDATDDGGIDSGNVLEKVHNENNPFVSRNFTSMEGEGTSFPDSILRTPMALSSKKSRSTDLETLKEQALAEGYMLVPIESDLTPKKENSADIPVTTRVQDSENWYDADNFENSSGTAIDALAEKAELLGFELVPSSEQFNQKTMSLKDLSDQAALYGLVVLEEATVQVLRLKADESKDRLEQLSEKLGYHILSGEQYSFLDEHLRNTELNFDNIHIKAEELGYHLLNEEQFEDLKDAAIAGKKELTEEELSEKATGLGLVALSSADYEQLVSRRSTKPVDLDEKTLRKITSGMGLTIISNKSYKDLLSTQGPKELSERDLEKGASQLGLKLLSNRSYQELKTRGENPTITKEMIVSRANDYGLAVLPSLTYEAMVSDSASRQSKESTISNAEKLGLRVLNQDQYNALLAKSKFHNMTMQDLTKKSEVLGMVLLPKEQMNKKAELNKDEVLRASGRFGLVSLDKKEFARLQRLAKPESLKERALAANMICLPKNAMIASADRANPDDVVVIPTTYYKKLLSREASMISARKQQAEMSKPSTRPPQRIARQDSFRSTQSNRPVHRVKEQRSINSLKGSSRSTTGAGAGAEAGATTSASSALSPTSIASRTDSHELAIPRANSMGAISLNTLESLNEPSIIPALTQTVIGEYLYKYYQVLGVGGESRHERYFWVHPYTMTLYWSPTNPAMESPTNHTAKCAPIAKVDSVVDKHASHGLYHKCLVITTDTRVIRIACSTRQRHNVWYNSLRYLLQRSMEGINMEDIAENPSDTMYSGKIFPLSKHPSKKSVSRAKSMSLLKK